MADYPPIAAPTLPRERPGDLAEAVRRVERELADRPRQGAEAAFPSLLLEAPDGSTWRVRVGSDGALFTVQVIR